MTGQLTGNSVYYKSMKLKKSDVEQIAKLVRLQLTDEEIRTYQDQLSEILGYIDQLKEVDTTNVAPTAQVTGQTNVLANDKVESKPDTGRLLKGTPLRDGDAIKVKAVFGNGKS